MSIDTRKISKFLSYVLRHDPRAANLDMDPTGWVPVDQIVRNCKISHDELINIVATNSKRRFEFDITGEKIRATQGHSVMIDLELTPAKPPMVLYHGTSRRARADIFRDGLKPMSRNHVHLSADRSTAVEVGRRHDPSPVILSIRSGDMYNDGYTFFYSSNGVWLTSEVPVIYLCVIA